MLLPSFEINLSGNSYPISEPHLWLSIKVSYDRGRDLVDKVLKSCSNNEYITVTDAQIKNLLVEAKDDNGQIIPGAPQERKFTLEVGIYNVGFTIQPVNDLNTSILTGKISAVNAPWATIEVITPNRRNNTVSHYAEVITDSSTLNPSIVGKKAIAMGPISCKDPKGNEKLFINATTFIAL